VIDLLLRFILPAAYSLLPSAMESPAATALLLSIALQESELEHRHQVGGPALSFFQFERVGVGGVLDHRATRDPIRTALRRLRYDGASTADVHRAMEHNDVLAACLARCLLWTDPRRLPRPDEPQLGWQVYLDRWEPGKPHPDTWGVNYATGWARVNLAKGAPD
jgi:hypothetical protein